MQQVTMTRYERQKARQSVHLHAILVLLLEAHSGMTSTVPVLCLATTVGTAGATVERRAKTGGSKTRAVTTLHSVAGNVRVLGNTEATARSTGVAERGRIVLLQCIKNLAAHALLFLGLLEWPGSTQAGDQFSELCLLLVFDVQSPHQIAGPADGTVEDVTFVGTLLLFFDRETHGDVARGRATAVATCEERGSGASACAGHGEGAAVDKLLTDFVVFQAVLRNEV